jgi:uncharacterized protein (TIGR00290 family)
MQQEQAAIKTYFNWSSGKDSALALYYLQADKNYRVEELVTSINAHYQRVSMHGLRRELLDQQVSALGLPHRSIELPEQPSMKEYETLMREAVLDLQEKGFECAAFGDIFLEDLRRYREKQLDAFGIKTVFPLWKKDTTQLMHEFIEAGFKAIVICINADVLDLSFAGRMIDKDFLLDLPAGVDACGENGEFHSFCFDGPIFDRPVPFEIGEKIYRAYKSPENENSTIGFWFCDLVPLNGNK